MPAWLVISGLLAASCGDDDDDNTAPPGCPWKCSYVDGLFCACDRDVDPSDGCYEFAGTQGLTYCPEGSIPVTCCGLAYIEDFPAGPIEECICQSIELDDPECIYFQSENDGRAIASCPP